MLSTRSFDLVKSRTFDYEKNKFPRLKGSVGADLRGLEQDRAIKTDPGETRRRRTIRLSRSKGQTWGFTLQTYGIRNKRTQEVEIMSYVDKVEIDGSACIAGMRRGDIILSINGESVESCTHKELVKKIQSSGHELRLVVLFEDCCQKVELHERYLRLKKQLSQKNKELRGLEEQERKICQGIPLSRLDMFRQSNYSSSSCSSDWDVYSEITSPSVFDTVPANKFAFCNQSFSDISFASSANSAGELSPDINCPEPNNEEEIETNLSRQNSEEGIDINFPKPNNEEGVDNFPKPNSEEEIDNFPKPNSEEEIDNFPKPDSREKSDTNFPEPNSEEESDFNISTSNREDDIDILFHKPNHEEEININFSNPNREDEIDISFLRTDIDDRLHSRFVIPNNEEVQLNNNFPKSKFASTNIHQISNSSLEKRDNISFSRLQSGEYSQQVISRLVDEGDKKLLRFKLEKKNSLQHVTESIERDNEDSSELEEADEKNGGLLRMGDDDSISQDTLTGTNIDNIQPGDISQDTLTGTNIDNIQSGDISQDTLTGTNIDNIQSGDINQDMLTGTNIDIQPVDINQGTLTRTNIDNIHQADTDFCLLTSADIDSIQHEGADRNKIIDNNHLHDRVDCENILAMNQCVLSLHQNTNSLTTNEYLNSHLFSQNPCLLHEGESSTKHAPIIEVKTKEINDSQQKPMLPLRKDDVEDVHSSDLDVNVMPKIFYFESSNDKSAVIMELNGEHVSLTCISADGSLAETGGTFVSDRSQDNVSNDPILSQAPMMCDTCRECTVDSDGIHTCQPSLLYSSSDGKHQFQKSHDPKDVSCLFTSKLADPPQLLASSYVSDPTLTQQIQPADCSSKRRLINGVLVNDTSYSTRL